DGSPAVVPTTVTVSGSEGSRWKKRRNKSPGGDIVQQTGPTARTVVGSIRATKMTRPTMRTDTMGRLLGSWGWRSALATLGVVGERVKTANAVNVTTAPSVPVRANEII